MCLRLKYLFTLGLGIVVLVASTAADANWEARSYKNGTYAALSMTLPTAYERHAVLVIDFSANKNCMPHVGINVFKGSRLGTPIKTERMLLNSMYVQTAGLRWSGGEIRVIYTNGFEVMMPIREDFIQGVKKQGTVYAQVGTGPIYSFPNGGNLGAIETARKACWSLR